jgi:hypothetical protein
VDLARALARIKELERSVGNLEWSLSIAEMERDTLKARNKELRSAALGRTEYSR